MFEENAPAAADQPDVQGMTGAPGRQSMQRGSRKGGISRMGSPIEGGSSAVRIGRAPEKEKPLPLSSATVSSEALSAGIAEIRDLVSGIRSQQRETEGVTGQVVKLEAKFDAMREAFDTLEAHVSIGLKNSVAEVVRTEIAALEELTHLRKSYRLRYRMACALALLLGGALVYERYTDQINALVSAVL